MIQTPQIEPVTTLARDHKSIFARLGRGPVFLANRSKPTAVLVSIADWDSLYSNLESLQDKVEVLEAQLLLAASGGRLEEVDLDYFPLLADADEGHKRRVLRTAEGIAESQRAYEAIKSGKAKTISHDELVKLVAEKQTDAAEMGN